jgi:hypothetical protein
MVGFQVYRLSRPPGEFTNFKGLAGVSSNDVLSVKMERMAEQAAMDAWTRAHVRVHIGIHSLPEFERYLGLLSQSPQFQSLSPKDKQAEAIVGGAFVGEAIRRTHGGTWLAKGDVPDVPDEGVFYPAFKVQGWTIWPVTWCLKRLVNGPEDNIYKKYEFFVLQRTNDQGTEITQWTNTDSEMKPVTNFIVK